MNMESFNAPHFEGEGDKENTVLTPEEITARITELESEIVRLKELSEATGENIDAPLGGEEYIDYGHMAQAREYEEEVGNLKVALATMESESEGSSAGQGDLFPEAQ